MLWLCQLQQPEQRKGSHTGDDVYDDIIGDDDDGNGDGEEGNDGDDDVDAINRG